MQTCQSNPSCSTPSRPFHGSLDHKKTATILISSYKIPPQTPVVVPVMIKYLLGRRRIHTERRRSVQGAMFDPAPSPLSEKTQQHLFSVRSDLCPPQEVLKFWELLSQRRLFKLCETLQTRKNILYPSLKIGKCYRKLFLLLCKKILSDCRSV